LLTKLNRRLSIMREVLSPSRKRRLIRRLTMAARTLQGWEASLHRLGEQHPGARPDLLLSLLHSTLQNLQVRLAELGAPIANQDAPSPKLKTPIRPRAIYEYCLRACRACGRALSQAFRVAHSVADAISAQLLYNSIRALEKQIWIFEPRNG
jgi:hypothetical protein